MKNAKTLVRTLFGAAVVSLFLGISSCKDADKNDDPKEIAEDENDMKFDENDDLEDDSEFMVAAAEKDMIEIELGKLAQSKASNPEVKKFADMMVSDHTKSSNEMKPLAQRLNVSLPATLTQKGQEKLDELNEKTGKDFDQKYMEMMVEGHDDAVSKFEKAAQNANDTELRSWAAGKVPALKSHHEHAKTLRDQIK